MFVYEDLMARNSSPTADCSIAPRDKTCSRPVFLESEAADEDAVNEQEGDSHDEY